MVVSKNRFAALLAVLICAVMLCCSVSADVISPLLDSVILISANVALSLPVIAAYNLLKFSRQ